MLRLVLCVLALSIGLQALALAAQRAAGGARHHFHFVDATASIEVDHGTVLASLRSFHATPPTPHHHPTTADHHHAPDDATVVHLQPDDNQAEPAPGVGWKKGSPGFETLKRQAWPGREPATRRGYPPTPAAAIHSHATLPLERPPRA